MVLEGLQGHRSVAELCNDYRIHQSQYYSWREKLLRDGANAFQGCDTNKKEKKNKCKKDGAHGARHW